MYVVNFIWWLLLTFASLNEILDKTLTLCMLGNFTVFFLFFCSLWTFFKLSFKKKSFRNTISVSNSSDPDQARHLVGPDRDPNCLQRLSTDDKCCR